MHSQYPGGHNEGFPDTFKQLFRSFYNSVEGSVEQLAPYPTFEEGHREILYAKQYSKVQNTRDGSRLKMALRDVSWSIG